MIGKVVCGRSVFLDRASRRDMIRRDGVAQQRQDTRARDIFGLAGLLPHADKIRRFADIRRVRIPAEKLAFRKWHLFPALIALEDLAVFLLEHVRPDGPSYGVA